MRLQKEVIVETNQRSALKLERLDRQKTHAMRLLLRKMVRRRVSSGKPSRRRMSLSDRSIVWNWSY